MNLIIFIFLTIASLYPHLKKKYKIEIVTKHSIQMIYSNKFEQALHQRTNHFEQACDCFVSAICL